MGVRAVLGQAGNMNALGIFGALKCMWCAVRENTPAQAA